MGNNLAQRVGNNQAARQSGTGGTSIAAFIVQMQPEIAKALPKGMNAERMARLALTAIRQTPKLAECSPASFMGALLTASSLGLEPNTPQGEAYLIPYKQECTFVMGYQGMTKLFYQHPLGKHIAAHSVREGDEFDYAYGLSHFLRHKPALGNDGPVVAFYAVAELQTGASDFVVLSPSEVRVLRQGKTGPSGNIADPQLWMERKTALRQLLKTMPKSTQMAAALAADEQPGTVLDSARRADVDLSSVERAVVDVETGEVSDGWAGDGIPVEDPPEETR